MKYNKYTKNGNIIHDVEITDIEKLKNTINMDRVNNIFKSNKEFLEKFKSTYDELNFLMNDISINYNKKTINHGSKPIMRNIITQNVNCYKKDEDKKEINLYFDLTIKYTDEMKITFNRFILTTKFIDIYEKLGYKVNFIPVLLLKAFNNRKLNNEYIYIKFMNLKVNDIINADLINNDDTSRVLLPEIVKLLNIENKKALDYNGYLLERNEKELLINPNDNDLLIDIFTTENDFTGEIDKDSKIFVNKIR